MTDPNTAKAALTPDPDLLPLAELFPLCFDWEQPRPVKLNIHKDLARLGHDTTAAKRSLAAYCARPGYRQSVRAGVARVDLQGQPAGLVTDKEAEHARQVLLSPAERKAERKAIARQALPPPITPLPQDYLVPGRLDLTVKFSELPRPLAVQGGMKIGVQTGEGIVTAVLPPKVWKKLEQAAAGWPAWVAAMSGSLERFEGDEIALKNPAVQVFEKKAPAA